MKKLTIILLTALFLASCSSSSTNVESGQAATVEESFSNFSHVGELN